MTAIVTGASRGIGVYIARALAEEGANLSLAARSADELEQVRAEMEALGVEVIATICDVAVREDRARLIERTEAELGPIDILINNAGIERVRRFETAPDSDFTDTLAINLEAPILLTRAVVPGMLARKRGHVVNIASGAGKVGVAYGTSYCASKHGLVGFTHALRAEYEKSPVGFSVVCPGFVTDAGMYDRWEQRGVHAPQDRRILEAGEGRVRHDRLHQEEPLRGHRQHPAGPSAHRVGQHVPGDHTVPAPPIRLHEVVRAGHRSGHRMTRLLSSPR